MPVEAATDKSDGVRRAFYSLILSSHWRRCWRLIVWRQNLSCHPSFLCFGRPNVLRHVNILFFLFGRKQILLSIKQYLFLEQKKKI